MGDGEESLPLEGRGKSIQCSFVCVVTFARHGSCPATDLVRLRSNKCFFFLQNIYIIAQPSD